MIFLSIFHAIISNIDFKSQLERDYEKTKIVILRCFFGVTANILVFEALKYIRVSSCVVLYDTYPMFATLISVLFLGATVTNFQILTYFICFLGILLISKPGFLFPSKDIVEDTILGVFLSLCCSFINSIGIVLNKQIAFDFDVMVSMFLYGILFVVESIIVGFFDGKMILLDLELNFSLFWMLIMGIFYFYTVVFIVLGLNYGNPIKILPLIYTGVVYHIFNNNYFFNNSFDFFDMIGVGVIILVNIVNNLLKGEE